MFKRIFILLALLLCSSGQAKNINWQLPTLGGICFWTDVKVNQGWRIQKHVWTGHYRLLDGDDYRFAWGSFEDCLSEFSSHKKVSSTAPKALLIHGLTVKKNSLEPLEDFLKNQGFEVEYFRFACFVERLEKTSKSLKSVLDEYEQNAFVITHSTGAILARQYEKDYSSQGVEKIAMLTAPNNGIFIVDHLRKISCAWLLGVNGRRLHSEKSGLPISLPEPSVDFITVSGSNRGVNYYMPLSFYSESHDGLLTTATGYLPGAQKNYVVKGHHFTVMGYENVKQLLIKFWHGVED